MRNAKFLNEECKCAYEAPSEGKKRKPPITAYTLLPKDKARRARATERRKESVVGGAEPDAFHAPLVSLTRSVRSEASEPSLMVLNLGLGAGEHTRVPPSRTGNRRRDAFPRVSRRNSVPVELDTPFRPSIPETSRGLPLQ